MTEDANPLDGLLAPLTGAGPSTDPAEHPSDGTLSAYAEGKLAEAQELEVQEHLALCGRCRDLLLEFASFVEVPLADETRGVADLEAAKEWRALQARMTGEDGAFSTRIQEPERDRRLVKQLRVFQTVAAVLGAAVVGLVLYSVRIQGTSEFISSSDPIYFATTRSSHPREETVKIKLPCALNFSTEHDFSRYRVEIVSADGHPMLTANTSFYEGALLLRRDRLAPGDYKIQLFGLADAKAEPIGEPKKLIVLP